MADRELQEHAARYSVGQVILHRLFDYRGVIFDVDPVFAGTDAWYEANSRTRSPKDKPWYHVMVHDTPTTTYVSERNLKPDDSGDPVRHPLLDEVLKPVRGGGYQSRGRAN